MAQMQQQHLNVGHECPGITATSVRPMWTSGMSPNELKIRGEKIQQGCKTEDKTSLFSAEKLCIAPQIVSADGKTTSRVQAWETSNVS